MWAEMDRSISYWAADPQDIFTTGVLGSKLLDVSSQRPQFSSIHCIYVLSMGEQLHIYFPSRPCYGVFILLNQF